MMITLIIFMIFIIVSILITLTLLTNNNFIGFINNNSNKLNNTNNTTTITDKNNDKLNNIIIKSDKLINNDLCILIENKLLSYSPLYNNQLIFKDTIKVNNNYKFQLLNISGNDIVIYHPETNSYIYNSKDNKLSIGQLNILKPDNLNKAKFNLIYNTKNVGLLLHKLNITDILSKTGTFALQHNTSKLYLSNENGILNLNNELIPTNLIFYNLMKKKLIVNDLIEKFRIDKGHDKNKHNLCSMVRNGLIPNSFIECNINNDIEPFQSNNNTNDTNMNNSNDNSEFNFNIFNSHIKLDYQKLFKSYGSNLYNDDLETTNGVNILDELKNYHMSILNKNNELQSFIDKESIKLENVLDTKMEDLELIKLNKDSIKYYTFKNK
jgi:cell division protein ZapA (FtsZ GTPase activity inhibitor)